MDARDVRERKRLAARARRAANPEREAARSRRKNYGLREEQFEAMLAAQGGRCPICRVGEATSVDHCHATGRIRALLCRACNAGLGFFADDPQLLRAAAAYLGRR